MDCSKRIFCLGLGAAAINAMLSSGSARGELIIPHIQSPKLVYDPIGETGPLGTLVDAMAWHPDGLRLATKSWGGTSIQLWDVEAKKRIWELRKPVGDSGSSLAFTPDGKQLIISSALSAAEDHDAGLSLVDVESGIIARNIRRPEGMENASFAANWALNASGSRLAVSFFSARRLPFAVYDTATWQAVVIDSPAFHQRRFVFDPVSGVVATHAPALLLGAPNPTGIRPVGRPPSIEIWDVDTPRLVRRLFIPYSPIAYLPRSQVLVMLGMTSALPNENVTYNITLFDTTDDKSEHTKNIMNFTDQVKEIAVGFNGDVLFAATWGGTLTTRKMSKDKMELMWSRDLDVKQASVDAPVFNPKSDRMAFAMNNLICLAQI
jgi:WD40 repeat protein